MSPDLTRCTGRRAITWSQFQTRKEHFLLFDHKADMQIVGDVPHVLPVLF